MLAPRASSAFICIRCELRLARSGIPFRPFPSSHASLSTSPTRRDDAQLSQDAGQPQQKGRPRTISNKYPLGKLWKRKGKAAIRESTAQLEGVKTLGKDSKILVFREVGDVPEEEKDIPAPSVPEPSEESPSVLASLQAQSIRVEQDEINQQLDSLRPGTHLGANEAYYMSRAAFLKLNRSILKGFTFQQLSRYYATSQGTRNPPLTEKGKRERKKTKGTGKKPIDRSKWYPGVTATTKRLPGSILYRRPKRKPVSKLRLADQITRQLWNIELLEEIEAPGEIEITLRAWQLELLNARRSELLNTGATPSALDRIGEMRKVKIEIVLSNVLRITADKSSAEYAADDIEQHLKNTEVQKFFLEPWRSLMQEDEARKDKLIDILPENSLKTINTVAGTISRAVNDNTIAIRGLDKDSVQEARRSLIRLLPLKQSTDTIESSRLHTRKDGYIMPCFSKGSLSYCYRSLDLGRWTFPVTNRLDQDTSTVSEQTTDAGDLLPGVPVAEADTDSPQTKLLRILSHRHSENSVRPKSVQVGSKFSYWMDPQSRTSAQFGHVLFPINSDLRDPIQTDLKPYKRTISTAIPALSRIVTTEAVFGPPTAIWTQFLQYEFEPSPYQQNQLKNLADYPKLTLRFESGSKPTLDRVSLTFNAYNHDILLPDKAVDISFHQFQTLHLKQPLRLPGIKAFSDAVCANIKSGDRLTAQQELTLEMPRWTMPKYLKTSRGLRTVTYVSAGITHEQGFTGYHNGFPLSYTVKQRGKMGARGGELALSFKEPKRKKEEADAMTLKHFVEAAFGLADRITEAAASTEPLSRVGGKVPAGKKKRREESKQGQEKTPDKLPEENQQDQEKTPDPDVNIKQAEVDDTVSQEDVQTPGPSAEPTTTPEDTNPSDHVPNPQPKEPQSVNEENVANAEEKKTLASSA